MDQAAIREAVVKLFQRKGYSVQSLSGGQGVPRNSRLAVARAGESKTLSVKLSEGGRISYTRNEDGTYKVLSEVDEVIYVRPENEGYITVAAFARNDVIGAFEANFRALEEHGMAHIPSWVNPTFESGWRLTGSGFGTKALWQERVDLDGQAAGSADSPLHPPLEENTTTGQGNIMERVRGMLSAHFGVPVSDIEIEVRIKA